MEHISSEFLCASSAVIVRGVFDDNIMTGLLRTGKTHTCSYMGCPFEYSLILGLLKKSESQQGAVRQGTVCW